MSLELVGQLFVLFGNLFKEHLIYFLIIAGLGWWGWQERKECRIRTKEQAAVDREDAKNMITALVEVRDALRKFEELIDRKFPRTR